MLIDLIKSIKNNDTIWVMENRENSDKFFKEYVTDKLFSSTYVIVSSELVYVFVHKLDEGNVHVLDENYSRVYIYSTAEELRVKLLEVLKKLSFPKQMLLSYTTMSDENTDIISYSSYKRVTKLFRSMYKENDKKIKVNSAQMNIYDIISKNTKEDIERLKKLASITDKILKESFYSIKVGQSEKDIALNTKNITKKIMDNKKIMNLNKKLESYAKDNNNVTYINIYDKLTDKNGNLNIEYTRDGLHLSEKGYEIVTENLKKYIKKR